MSEEKRVLIRSAIALTILAGAGPAYAERLQLVLIDVTGSMSQTRTAPPQNQRLAEALFEADERVVSLAGNGGLDGVAVFIFHNDGFTPRTLNVDGTSPFNGTHFVDVQTARNQIAALATATVDGFPLPFGSTPLATSMCQAVGELRGLGTAGATRILSTFTDGGENSSTGGCAGDPAVGSGPPFTANSWQDKVYTSATAPGLAAVAFDITFYFDVSFAAGGGDPQAAALAAAGRSPARSSSLEPLLSDAAFFTALARDTHGQIHLVSDASPPPLFADLNADACIDHADAVLVARQFGQPSSLQFDLDGDGVIGFSDYTAVTSRIGQGCTQPDPFVARQLVSCKGGDQVVIDGQAIESSGLTIEAHGNCNITIRNSIIVSGQNAIQINGSARITVDNSVIVGGQALIVLHGNSVLSAAGSTFHGQQSLKGNLQVIDRGGNVFE